VKKAHQLSESGHTRGKIVLQIGGGNALTKISSLRDFS